MGYYEFFLLCEALGAKPLPVLNVGLACQYQSYEMVQPGTEAFGQYLQDALDLIEFANGAEDGRWGSVRVAMGHKEPFHLTMLELAMNSGRQRSPDFLRGIVCLKNAFMQNIRRSG